MGASSPVHPRFLGHARHGFWHGESVPWWPAQRAALDYHPKIWQAWSSIMGNDEAWKRTLSTLDVATATLRRSFDDFLLGSADGTVVAANLAALIGAIPRDVLDRRQHPLSVAAKELRGTVQQALDGRQHARDARAPEWLKIVDEDARSSLAALEEIIAKLLRDGAPEH